MNNSTTKQKKLLICADSFCAEEKIDKKRWAWWNLLARDLNAETINLSIVGASNFNIFLQLEEGLKHNPDYILVSLTAPNRIEETRPKYDGLNSEFEPLDVTYKDLQSGRLSSWAVHERIERNQITGVQGYKFFDYNVNKRKDELIVESILDRLKGTKNLVLSNLFWDCNLKDNVNFDIVPKNYCDVVTGQLDEEEAGHIHKSYHVKFYYDELVDRAEELFNNEISSR